MKYHHLAAILLFFFFFSFPAAAQRNVILIIADDLGSDYCGFYENHLDTVKLPNIRKLLLKGVRFRNAWSNPLCSPTRAGILTGRYSFRTGVGNAVGGTGSAVLDTSEKTIPRLLKEWSLNQLTSANIGKWHLHLPMPSSNFSIPNKMGYDYFEGNFLGTLTSYTNWKKIKDGQNLTITNYATTETANNAISWVKSVPPTKPFFLWLAFNAPHTPYHLPPSNLHSYTTLSGTDADIATNPKDYFKAMAEAMDTEIGRLFDSLKVVNRFDSTEIIFIGDNGNESSVSQIQGGAKGSIYQEGISVPFIISGPGVVQPNRASDALVKTQDLFATILEMFENTNWPSQIPANKPVDSKSIIPILKNQTDIIRPWVFTEIFKVPTVSGDGKTMRNKQYKLLDFDNGTQKFYKIDTDPGENQDLLTGTLSAAQEQQYSELCSQMTNLVGIPRFCDLVTENPKEVRQSETLVVPNPFRKSLRLQTGTENKNEIMRLTDPLGTVIFEGSDLENQDFSRLAAGVYFLKPATGSGKGMKVVKVD